MSRKKLGGKNTRSNNVLKSRDKVLTKMTKDGAVEQNATTHEETRISKRNKGFDLRSNPADMPVDIQASDVVMDMPAEIFNAMFSVGENSDKPTNHSDYSSSSQVGTRLNHDNTVGILGDETVKRNSAKKQQRQAYSRNGSSDTGVKPTPQPFAEIYDFPKPTDDVANVENTDTTKPTKQKTNPTVEHEPQGRIRHKSKTPVPLNEHRLSNLKQSPKSSKFIVAPAVDDNGRRIDVNADVVQTPKQRKRHAQLQQSMDSSDVSGKLKFEVDDIDTSAIENFDSDEKILYSDIDSETKPHEYDPANQPRSPTVSPNSLRSQQFRNSRKHDNLKHDGTDTINHFTDATATRLEHITPDIQPIDSTTPQPLRNSSQRQSQQSDSSALSDAQSNTPTDTSKLSPQISKLEHKLEKTSGKLDKAKGNLPAKRKVGIKRTFDEDTGKGKTRLTFDKEVKTQREHLKGPLPLRPVKFGVNTAIAKAHVKMFQIEDENVGVKAAHKVELAGEAVVRSALRHRKLVPYKKVVKLERKLTKRSAKLAYQRTLHENPRLKKNPIARMWQKRKIKRKHIKAAKQAKQAAIKATKAGSLTTRAIRTVTMLIKKNPKVIIAVVALFLIVNILSSIIGMLSSIGSSGAGAIFATTYLSEEIEIENASLAYNRWEMDLMLELLNAEQNHPGFDEYRFNTGQIIHNPFELMAYLTATRFIFTFSEIEAELRALFDEQYQLSFTPSVEVRFRDSGELDAEGNPIYVPFDWHVMTVTLIARNFTDVIFSRMTPDQRLHYDLLMQTRGQRQIVANPFAFGWQQFITSGYGYRIHPITGAVDLHRGIDIGVPTGTEILAGFDGTVTFAGMLGGYGNVVIIQGANGLEARYAHMDTIGVTAGQSVDMGDVVGTVGSTGSSTGPHLHMEVLRNGQFLNPIFFVDMGHFISSPNYGIPSAAMGDETFALLWEVIQQALGKPYVWGASGPNAFDCSGFIFHTFNQSGVMSIPRTTAQGYYNMSTRISRSELRPGDLVFFQGTFSTYRTVTHVGIYLGGNLMAHAGSPVEITSFETPFWTRHFYGFGRLIH